MSTKTQIPKPAAEQRLADSYGEPGQTGPTPSTPPARHELSPEQRIANAYRRQAPGEEPARATPPRPPLTPDERLAATYAEPAKTADAATDNADGADEHEGDNPDKGNEPAGRIRAPEGFQLDAEMERALSSVGNELKLPNDTMQKLVDKMSPALAEQTNRHVQRVMDEWVEETMNDSEIGGERLDETMTLARRAIIELGTPELRKLLGPRSSGGTGIGNNRAMLAFLARVGRELA